MGCKGKRKWCNIWKWLRGRWGPKKQRRRSTNGKKGRWRRGRFDGIRFKTRDKSINADDARQRSLGKVGHNHLEKFWVNERRRWGIMSRWKWNGNSVVAEVRGVLLISVTLEWAFSPLPLRSGQLSTYFTWWDFRQWILWFWLWQKKGSFFYPSLCGGVKWTMRA